MKSAKLLAHHRRKQRTNHIKGTAEKPRLVVSRSNMHMTAQLIDDLAGKTLVSAHDLKAKKGSKLERAKAIGEDLAKKAIANKIDSCVFDRNGHKYHGRVKALAEGAREAGLKF